LRHNDKFEKRGLSVEVRNNDVAFALRKFKKKIQEDGILQELRQREFYEKPTTKRAKAKKAGIARWKKKLASMNEATPTSSKNRLY
jgi:small subunit ribosomal protein S21|tara:strand:- start:171 stop:428 length:258 start_codon:yes stop_codon:yes gene_type:complete